MASMSQWQNTRCQENPNVRLLPSLRMNCERQGNPDTTTGLEKFEVYLTWITGPAIHSISIASACPTTDPSKEDLRKSDYYHAASVSGKKQLKEAVSHKMKDKPSVFILGPFPFQDYARSSAGKA